MVFWVQDGEESVSLVIVDILHGRFDKETCRKITMILSFKVEKRFF